MAVPDRQVQHILAQERRVLAERYSVSALYLFGSTLRSDRHAGSDVDLLAEFSEPVALLQFIRLQQHLKRLLGCKVDLARAARSRKVCALRCCGKRCVPPRSWQVSAFGTVG